MKIKKKPSRGIASRNICTKFGAYWNIFRYGNDDTTSVTHTNGHRITQSLTHKLLVTLLRRMSEKPRKKVQLNQRK